MSEAKPGFTPGPWVLIRSGMRDNSAVATIEEAPPEMEGPNYWTIAQTNTGRDEWQANARLIAAAPAMYDALKCARSVLFLLSAEVKALGFNAGAVPEKVRAAIEQAEGA